MRVRMLSISMEVELNDKGNFVKYKDERASKFAMISAETGGVNVNDKDSFFDPLVISAAIDNRQKVANVGYSMFTSSEGQAYKGFQAVKYKAYKDFGFGNQKRFNGNLYQQNLSLSTVYNAMDNPVLKLETNYSVTDAKYLLYNSHLGGSAQGGSAFNITYPAGKSDRFVSVQGDTKFKKMLIK